MDYINEIDSIIEILKGHGYDQEAERITVLRSEASNSTELLMSITYEILKLSHEKQEINNFLDEKVKLLQNYCHSIGLMVNL